MTLLDLKNHKKEKKMRSPATPVINNTQLKADELLNNPIGKFIPNIPATTPKIATTNVAVVNNNSNCIS